MENIYQTLYEQQDYENLVKQTASLKDLNTIRYHVIGLLGLGAHQLVLRIMLMKLPVIKTVLPMFLKIHAEILKEHRSFQEHVDLMEAYEQLPYISQETDEGINTIRRLYFKPPHAKNLSLTQMVVEADTVRDESLLIDLIPQLKAIELYQLKTQLKTMLLSTYSQHLKGVVVIAFITHRYDETIDMAKEDKIISFNPIDSVNPFENGTFEAYKLLLDEQIKDPSLRNISYSILSTYMLKMIPFEFEVEYYFIQAIRSLTHQYLRLPTLKFDVSEEELSLIKKKHEEIESIIKT